MSFYFELTGESIQLVESEDLTGPAQARLLDLLFKKFPTKKEFLEALLDALRQKHFAVYRAQLLEAALVPENFEIDGAALTDLEVAGFPKATLGRLEKGLEKGVRFDLPTFEKKTVKAIGARQAKRFRTLLFRHCRKPFLLPYYICRVGDRDFMVDVTLSTPPQSKASKVAERFLGALNGHFGSGTRRKICDMGTGKLRNLEPFLNAGYTAFVCDYEEQYDYAASEDRLEELRSTYGKSRLHSWIFPDGFRDGELEQLDAVLLLNVLHIIPYPGDRQRVLAFCVDKLEPGGLLAWQTPYGDTNMMKHCKRIGIPFGDGWILRPDEARQTFYTEFRISKIREMLADYPLEELSVKIEAGKNKAKVFRKV